MAGERCDFASQDGLDKGRCALGLGHAGPHQPTPVSSDFQPQAPWGPVVPIQWLVIACPHCHGSKCSGCKHEGLVKRRYNLNELVEL